MDEVEELIRKHIAEGYMMQLATVHEDQPWCCTVYFVTDKDLNFYWFSLPTRRHSEEIDLHPKAAIAIPIKHGINDKKVGIQAEGKAVAIKDTAPLLHIVADYAKKFKRDEKWVEDVINRRTQHQLYKFTPKLFALFDEQTYTPPDSRKEWRP